MPIVLIIDNHPIIAEGIKNLLEGSDMTIVRTGTLAHARMLSQSMHRVNIAVADLTPHDCTDCLELKHALNDFGYHIPVVYYTARNEPFTLARIIKSGVEGAVLKTDPLSELSLAIKRVLSGKRHISQSVQERLLLAENIKQILSDKTIDILRRVACGQSNREISQAISLSEKTIEYHRGIILRKLSAGTMPQAVNIAIRFGIINPNEQ